MLMDQEIAIKEFLPSPDNVMKWITTDDKYMIAFGIAVKAVKMKGYNKTRHRLKISAIKNKFIDTFISEYIKTARTIILAKNKIITDYFSDDMILERLDKLLLHPFQKYYKRNDYNYCKAYQEYLYFEKEGRDRFRYSKVGLDYYDKTGKEPWSFYIG